MENSESLVEKITKYLKELESIVSLQSFEKWVSEVRKVLLNSFSSSIICEDFEVLTRVIENKFSGTETQRMVEDAKRKAQTHLSELIAEIRLGKFERTTTNEDIIDKSVAIIIIRRILRNL